MLLELAIGDAYGAGFEYVSNKIVRERNDLSTYIRHQRHNIPPGHYTDDTQMSIALAELIVSGEEWSRENIAKYFVDVFKRDIREGYASRFYNFLLKVKDGDDFLKNIRPESDKSGAAMRAGVVGLFSDIDEVIEKTTIQAQVTHNTKGGINSAVAAALMVHYFYYKKGTVSELQDFLIEYVYEDWSVLWKGKVGAKGMMSTKAAYTALISNNSMSELLKQCVVFTGDVDTVATIALAAASLSKEYEQDLPNNLVDDLENEKYGRDYLIELDKRLFEKINEE